MTLHGRLGTHAVKQHELLAVLFDHGTFTFIMSSQHATEHDKVSTATKGLSNVTRDGTTAIAHDLPAKTMRGIRTFNDSRKLRVTHAGFDARSTYGPRPDTDFHDISPGENQLLHHLTGDNVASTDDFIRTGFSYALKEG